MASELVGVNMTTFFKRPLAIYALGDFQFKKPLSLRWMVYLLAGLVIWTLPMFLIFGLKFNPFFFAFLVGPPILIAKYATKPIFGGKNLLDFTKTMAIFLREPKCWMDLSGGDNFGKIVYHVRHEIWISRRRELRLLAELKAKRNSKRKKLS